MACRSAIAGLVGATMLSLSLPATAAPVEGSADAGAALVAGAADRLETAAKAFADARRTEAVVALDEAHRVALVGKHAEKDKGVFATVEKQLAEARRFIQMGKPETATQRIDDALAALSSATPPALEQPVNLSRYDGASLLNVHGKVLGEVGAGIDGDRASAMIGDWLDTFGFLDLGGEAVALPVNRLVFGPTPAWGPIRVILAEPADQKTVVGRYAY